MTTQYRVAYECQLITEPLDMVTALDIAIEENLDALESDHMPLAEIVIARSGELGVRSNEGVGIPAITPGAN